jgi:hypothetical protein
VSDVNLSRPGWRWGYESPPAKVRHYLPASGDHELSHRCWCRPTMQNEKGAETIVIHNEAPA